MALLRVFVATLVLCLLASCSQAPLTPQETVALYLRRMIRDPMRVLPMLTDDFHRAHGMLFANTVELPFGIVLDPEHEAMPRDPEFLAERGRLGWLTAPSASDDVYQVFPILQQLQLGFGESHAEGDRAQVVLMARVPDEAQVDFVFELRRRAASEPWRIDAVNLTSRPTAAARFIRYRVAPDLDSILFIRREATALE